MNSILIHNFDQVEKASNSLYVIDIDDTLLHYYNLNKKWLSKEGDILMNKYNKTEALRKLYNKWEKELHKVIPIATDYYGINNLIQFCSLNNSDIIFLTARNKRVEEITRYHVSQIIHQNFPIYFAGGRSKGKILKNILNKYNYTKYNHIYFIDDLEENCESVENELPNIKTYLYKF